MESKHKKTLRVFPIAPGECSKDQIIKLIEEDISNFFEHFMSFGNGPPDVHELNILRSYLMYKLNS